MVVLYGWDTSMRVAIPRPINYEPCHLFSHTCLSLRVERRTCPGFPPVRNQQITDPRPTDFPTWSKGFKILCVENICHTMHIWILLWPKRILCFTSCVLLSFNTIALFPGINYRSSIIILRGNTLAICMDERSKLFKTSGNKCHVWGTWGGDLQLACQVLCLCPSHEFDLDETDRERRG